MSIAILAIESSCDETSAAVVIDGKEIKSNIIYTQIATHKAYGGVVPEIASREHLRKISSVVKEAIRVSNVPMESLDAIAVTKGPGLIGSLLVGVSYAKAMAFSLGIPLIGVHHLSGHLYGGIMSAEQLEPPLVALIASGGHSTLVFKPGMTLREKFSIKGPALWGFHIQVALLWSIWRWKEIELPLIFPGHGLMRILLILVSVV